MDFIFTGSFIVAQMKQLDTIKEKQAKYVKPRCSVAFQLTSFDLDK